MPFDAAHYHRLAPAGVAAPDLYLALLGGSYVVHLKWCPGINYLVCNVGRHGTRGLEQNRKRQTSSADSPE